MSTIPPAYERYRLEKDDSTVCGRFDRLGEDGVPVSLGIMGGTFDPIHSGHLMCAERAREEFGLSAVVFMPAGQPVRKLNTFVASAEDRYIMARLATQDNAAFDVSAMEIRREGKTYAIDTLRALRAYYPLNVRLYFITGADAIWDIISWKGAEELALLATFVGATRPGYDLDEARRRHERADIAFDIKYLDIPALAISSTEMRTNVAAGRSIRYLTPAPVCAYIAETGLYTAHQPFPNGRSGKGFHG